MVLGQPRKSFLVHPRALLSLYEVRSGTGNAASTLEIGVLGSRLNLAEQLRQATPESVVVRSGVLGAEGGWQAP